MSAHFERGRLLLERGRHELAEKELRLALAEDPEDPDTLALLGLVLSKREQHLAAERTAREAVRLAPDRDFPLYVLAGILNASDKRRDALQAVDRAIEIDPEDADFWARRAHILTCDAKWDDAVLAADTALGIDPECVDAMNLRSLCLQQLGRTSEAAATADNALRGDPDSGMAHANRGWAYLRQGNHRAAERHFREALRLEPDMEWAREGVVTSLKARNIVYRGVLKYFFWMGRLSAGAQWAVIIGLVLGRRVLRWISDEVPEIRGPAIVLGVLILAFMLLTWVADPVSNFVLLLHPFGRLALSRTQRIAAYVTGGLFFLALGSLGLFAVMEDALWGLIAAGWAAYTIPVAGVSLADGSRQRKLFWVAAAIGAVGVAALVLALVGAGGAPTLGGLYALGVVGFTWIAALIGRSE